jgi:hypothetical protein
VVERVVLEFVVEVVVELVVEVVEGFEVSVSVVVAVIEEFEVGWATEVVGLPPPRRRRAFRKAWDQLHCCALNFLLTRFVL